MSSSASTGGTAASTHAGVESHGIAPVPLDKRYGRPQRLFSVWFAPNLNITAVFTGALGISLGLDFFSAFLAILLGTVLGSMVTAYLCTWGPRTGTAQLPFARLPFGRGVALPGVLAWLSAIAWDALVGIFGGQAMHELTGVPLWLGIVIVLALEAVVGFFGYELIHRFQVISSYLLAAAFLVITIKIVAASELTTTATVHGGDRTGAWFLVFAIGFSLGISWAPYASDFSRYMPPHTSAKRMFAFTTLGMSLSYVWGQAIGAAGASALGDETAAGIRELLGGGVLGVIGLLTMILSSVSSNAMNDYSGSLSLQTIGVRIPRPVAALVVGACALALCLWMSADNFADRFENVLLLISYWIPCFAAVVAIDWWRRRKEADGTVDVNAALRHRHSGWPAVVALVAGTLSTLLFMDTTLWVGPVAKALHGADLAYYAGFLVAGAIYLALLPLAKKNVAPMAAAGADPVPAAER
ncbi:cytosine permease [Amycolatopsis acidicola]|uniref:Cytosine permease n=1 Tax=Amycolatopsis acidicola TaxID=2596893 RepID=A0A5N0VAX5_9PSEU|nr:cytosine permease [Amycolatopsis acidicola]KAA9162674.1 cytosine permease [Amycolatopsis acidicola]